MPSDVFSSYFGDEASPSTSGSDIYSSYFPEEVATTSAEGDLSPDTNYGKFHNFTEQVSKAATFGLGDKAAALGAASANKLMGNDFDYGNQLDLQRQEDKNYRQNHPIASKVASGIGMMSAMANTPGALPPPSILGKVGLGAAQGAEIGSFSGLGNSNDTSFQDDASHVANNALLGATIGGALPLAFEAGRGVGNFITGKGIDPQIANLAQKAQDKYGINVTGAQLSGSPFVKYIDSMSGKVPLSGGAEIAEDQHQQFAKAVAGTFGAKDLSQDGMNEARNKIRDMYNSVANNTVAIGDQKLLDGIDAIHQDASTADVNLDKIVGSIKNRFGDRGLMDASDYKSLTSKGAPLDRLMQSQDPNVRYYAGKLGDELDSSLARAASPEDLHTLVTADRYWKNMKTVQNLAAKSSADGSISVGNLQNAVMKSFKDYPYTGAGDLGELAKIGQMLKPVPSSSTAERAMATASMMFPPAAGEALLLGQPHVAAGIAATGGALMGGAKATQSVLNSQWYKNRLLQSVMGNGGQSFISNPVIQNSAMSIIPHAVVDESNRLQQ